MTVIRMIQTLPKVYALDGQDKLKIKLQLEGASERIRVAREIIVALAPTDARARKMASSSGSAQTDKGNTITVIKTSDASVPKGVERITVRAGRLQTEV